MFPFKLLFPLSGATGRATAIAQGGGASSQADATTVVLFHGAFADSASWNGVMPSGTPAWKQLPSWSIYSTADKNIPPDAMRFMSERAGARKVVEIRGASHVVMVSHADQVAALIVEAAR